MTVTVSSVSPDTDLNPAGGDTMVITGTGFPSVISIDENALSLAFDDGTLCDLTSATPTEMQCVTRAFDLERRRRRLTTLTMIVMFDE